MSVWFAVPSARPDGGTIQLWREKGYRIAVWRDRNEIPADLILMGEYPGYAKAVNALCREVRYADPDLTWIVTGGDDIEPDPKSPLEIAKECTQHFSGTFGVMQPTGDRWGSGQHIYSEHVCGSPWLGLEFCQRMYGGEGPFWPGWWHMYVDEELYEVAKALGVLWQRPDLIHYHRHWVREHEPEPEHLKDKNWTLRAHRNLFMDRKQAGFPGHEPL